MDALRGMTMAKESIEIRFGVVAVRKGYVTVDQVMAALG
jgi:hypothetical protein